MYVKSESFTNKLKVACKLKVANNNNKKQLLFVYTICNILIRFVGWGEIEKKTQKDDSKKNVSRDEKQKQTKINIPKRKKLRERLQTMR